MFTRFRKSGKLRPLTITTGKLRASPRRIFRMVGCKHASSGRGTIGANVPS
jgi:hypothetical protein